MKLVNLSKTPIERFTALGRLMLKVLTGAIGEPS